MPDSTRKTDEELKPIEFDLDSFGEFDETWFRGADVHIERMNETGFWIGFDLPGDRRVMLNTGVHKGVWFFNLEEDRIGGGNFVSVQRPRSAKPVPFTGTPKVYADLQASRETQRELVEALKETFEFFQGPYACGDFTCTCCEVKFCGICALRGKNAAILARAEAKEKQP